MRLEKGEIIGARYSLVRAIGEGGMGAVWAAHDTTTNELVALKVLRQEVKVPEVVRRFLREARAAMAVRHPNVVRIREVVTVDDEPVIVMDYLEGESLRARLEHVGKIDLAPFAQMFVAVVSAIGTAHAAGVVHRDLKPDNIFLLRLPDGKEEPRVVDFGIAKLTAIDGDAKQSGHLTTTGAVLGTPYYMSPEQVFGDKHIDHRTDVWSLGTIAFECLSGRRPVEGDNIGQILKVITTGGIPRLEEMAPGLPADVYELVGRMLSYDRTKRPYDLREVLNIFRRHTTHSALSFGEATIASKPADMGSGSGSSSGGTVRLGTPPGIITPPHSGGAANAPYHASTTGGAAMASPTSAVTAGSQARRGPILAMSAIGLVLVGGIGVAVAARTLRHDTAKTTASEQPPASVSASASAAVATLPPDVTATSPSSSASSSSRITIADAVPASKPLRPQPGKSASAPPSSVASSSALAATSSSSAQPAKTGAPIAPINPYEQK